jgi:hypothetical protein
MQFYTKYFKHFLTYIFKESERSKQNLYSKNQKIYLLVDLTKAQLPYQIKLLRNKTRPRPFEFGE